MLAQGYFKGKAATTELSVCRPVIPGCASEAPIPTEPYLGMLVKDDKESGINQQYGTVTTQDRPGRILKE